MCVCVLPVTKKKIIVPIYLLANKQLMNKRVLFLTTGCFYHLLWRLTIQNTARPASYGAYLYCNCVCSYKPHVIMLMMSVDGAVAKSLVNVQTSTRSDFPSNQVIFKSEFEEKNSEIYNN